MELCELKDFDRSGRRRPVPIEGAVVTQEFDTIFSAIGQGSDLEFAESIETKGDTITVDREGDEIVLHAAPVAALAGNA